MAVVVVSDFFINKAIQFRSVDTPTFSSFENVSIAIGSAAQQLVLTCVYRPPGSCSESFLDQFLTSVGSSPTSGNSEDLSQYDPGC